MLQNPARKQIRPILTKPQFPEPAWGKTPQEKSVYIKFDGAFDIILYRIPWRWNFQTIMQLQLFERNRYTVRI